MLQGLKPGSETSHGEVIQVHNYLDGENIVFQTGRISSDNKDGKKYNFVIDHRCTNAEIVEKGYNCSYNLLDIPDDDGKISVNPGEKVAVDLEPD